MAVIVPTVLARTPAEYTGMWERAKELSERIHVDICDGVFADNTTVGLAQLNAFPEGLLDLHLMLDDPTEQLMTALSLHPNVIILHSESKGDLMAAIKQIHELQVKVGVAFLPDTMILDKQELINAVDHVLIFTGSLGHNGGQLQQGLLDKAAQVRAMRQDVEISVDGGVNETNAALIQSHGVDVLYAGSYLQNAADPEAAMTTINHVLTMDQQEELN